MREKKNKEIFRLDTNQKLEINLLMEFAPCVPPSDTSGLDVWERYSKLKHIASSACYAKTLAYNTAPSQSDSTHVFSDLYALAAR